MNFARQVANRIVFMDKGQIIEQAKPEDFFTRRILFLPLNKRNTRDKAKGLCISSERYIVELGRRYLSTLLWREFAQSMIGALYIAKRLATFVSVITLPP
ncbi:MAG: hypothetical protein ACFNT7_00390, partial [Porphyromonas pasteri]